MTKSDRLKLYIEGVRLGVAGEKPPNHYFEDRERGIADGRRLREEYVRRLEAESVDKGEG